MLRCEFIECAKALKSYWNWENELCRHQIDISDTPAGKMADFLVDLIEEVARYSDCSILRNKETNVLYVDYSYGMTVLLNADGTPQTWKGH